MADISKQRSLEEIKQEYMRMLARAGDLQYQIVIFSKDLELVNNSLRDLNLEAVKASEAEKQAAAAAAQPQAEPAQG